MSVWRSRSTSGSSPATSFPVTATSCRCPQPKQSNRHVKGDRSSTLEYCSGSYRYRDGGWHLSCNGLRLPRQQHQMHRTCQHPTASGKHMACREGVYTLPTSQPFGARGHGDGIPARSTASPAARTAPANQRPHPNSGYRPAGFSSYQALGNNYNMHSLVVPLGPSRCKSYTPHLSGDAACTAWSSIPAVPTVTPAQILSANNSTT